MRWYVELSYRSGGRLMTHDGNVVEPTAHDALYYVMMRYFVEDEDLVLATVKRLDD